MASLKFRIPRLPNVLGPSYKSPVNQYKKLTEELESTHSKMEGLQSIKGKIEDSRFIEQEKEYQSIINRLTPQINELKKNIENIIDEKEKENIQLEIETITSEKKINQEKLLLEAGALSKEGYKKNVQPLEKKLKRQKVEADNIKKSIRFLKDAIQPSVTRENKPHESLSVKETTKIEHISYSPHNSFDVLDKDTSANNRFKDSTITNRTNAEQNSPYSINNKPAKKGSFGKDFGIGCLYFILIISGLIVAVLFRYKISTALFY